MILTAIHHVAIIVSNYEVSKDFYVNKLGFEIIRENYRPDKKDWKLDLRVDPDTELEIFAPEDPPKRLTNPEACGLRHLAFRTSDIEKTIEELKSVGIETIGIKIDEFTNKRLTFFYDPDSLPLELHE